MFFTKLKKSAKINIFGGWVTKGKIGSEFRPTHSQNFRTLAERTTEIQKIKGIALKN